MESTAPRPFGQLRRFPPARTVPPHDTSLMRLLFRGVRYPDTEWWWNSIHVVAAGATLERELSIITNVQLTARPLGAELRPAAVIAVRDVRSGQRWCCLTRGTLSDGRNCSFFSRGWSLSRLDPTAPSFEHDCLAVGETPSEAASRYPQGAYVIAVDCSEFRLRLVLRSESMARFGHRGWLDYDPRGVAPLWASSKVRMQSVEGTLRLQGDPEELGVRAGSAHFEQQCLLLTSAVAHVASPATVLQGPALLGLLEVRPKWHWYRVVLKNAHLCVFVIWCTRSRRPLRSFGALLDASGTVCSTSELEVVPFAYYPIAEVTVPERATIHFTTQGSPLVPAGDYEVQLHHDPAIDWRVPYVYGPERACMAHEAHAVASVAHNGQVIEAEAHATQETIDMVHSMVPWQPEWSRAGGL